METVTPFKEIIDEIKQKGGDPFKYCYQCGMCDAVCPWNRVRQFSMRKLVRQGALGLTEIESEDVWRCTTCGRCPQACPRGVKQIESGVAVRRMATEYDVFPAQVAPLKNVSVGLMGEGNPFNNERTKRADWAQGLKVKPFEEGMEVLFFACCYLAYAQRLQKVAAATVDILNKAGVSFGILGTKESCCGESIRKTGNEDLYRKLAKDNIRTFIDAGVKKILVSSPHSYHSFKNEYPEFMVHFEVVHVNEYIAELISSGRLKFEKEYPKRVTYHDPCYLGRHNSIYDEPRNILKSIPGLELTEMLDNRERSLCCGGGGGRIWVETPKGERFTDLRIQQALDVKAQVLATSCPYCITNFEDGRLSLEDADVIEVKDITEIVQEML